VGKGIERLGRGRRVSRRRIWHCTVVRGRSVLGRSWAMSQARAGATCPCRAQRDVQHLGDLPWFRPAVEEVARTIKPSWASTAIRPISSARRKGLDRRDRGAPRSRPSPQECSRGRLTLAGAEAKRRTLVQKDLAHDADGQHRKWGPVVQLQPLVDRMQAIAASCREFGGLGSDRLGPSEARTTSAMRRPELR